MAIATYPDKFPLVVLGSNEFIDTRALVRIDGEEQLHLERGSNDEQLLLTTDIYSKGGDHIAKLRRNAWAFHGTGYEITTSPTNLSLLERDTGRELFVARVADHNTILIDSADFYGVKGTHLVATPEAVMINGMITLSGNRMVGTDGISVGPAGFQM